MNDVEPKELVGVFAANVRRIRKSLGMTQAELASKLDVHVPYISDLERGKKTPFLGNLAKVAEALDVEPWVLIAQDEKIPV